MKPDKVSKELTRVEMETPVDAKASLVSVKIRDKVIPMELLAQELASDPDVVRRVYRALQEKGKMPKVGRPRKHNDPVAYRAERAAKERERRARMKQE